MTLQYSDTKVVGQDTWHLTLITLNPTLRRDTSQYSDTKETYYGTRDLTLDTWYTQPDTQQRLDTWPSAETHLYWHNTYYGTWQDTYYGTRHETLDTWYSHPNTLQWHCNILQYTWHLIHSTRHSAETHPHIVTQEIWDKTRDKTHIRYGTRETWHSSLSPWRSAETTWQDTRDTYHGIWQDKRHILWSMTRQETYYGTWQDKRRLSGIHIMRLDVTRDTIMGHDKQRHAHQGRHHMEEWSSEQCTQWVWRQELKDMTSDKGQESVGCEKSYYNNLRGENRWWEKCELSKCSVNWPFVTFANYLLFNLMQIFQSDHCNNPWSWQRQMVIQVHRAEINHFPKCFTNNSVIAVR